MKLTGYNIVYSDQWHILRIHRKINHRLNILMKLGIKKANIISIKTADNHYRGRNAR